MAQIFPKSANALAQASIIAAGILAVTAGGALYYLQRSPYVTRQHETREQPIPFSHQHHVGGMGVDCRYCHTAVEKSASAGIPPTKTCMNCHSQIWNDSPTLEPVRQSFREGRSIVWTKVNDLPDFAYFNHSAHVNKGMGCSTCHGRVDLQPLAWQEHSLQMEWCLECHRSPEKFVRPQDQVFNAAYVTPANQIELGKELVKKYGLKPRTSCSTCHR